LLLREITEEGIVFIFHEIIEEKRREMKFQAALQGVDLDKGKDVKGRSSGSFVPPPGAKVSYFSAEDSVDRLKSAGLIGGLK